MATSLQAVQEAGVFDPESLAGILSDADILSLMDQAEQAGEPGSAALGVDEAGRPIKDPRAVIFRGDADVPAPIMATALKSAGYVHVYDRESGERSTVSRNNLPQVLKKRHEKSGRQVFTTHKPAFEPVRGKLKCLLHAEERTEDMTAMGLPLCNKANIPSDYQRRLHMQVCHKSAWDALEEAKKIEREREERESRLAILRLAGNAPKAAPAPRAAVSAAEPEEATGEAPVKRERTPAQIAHAERLAQGARDRAAAKKAA